MLDGFELPLVQFLEETETEAFEEHAVPALEGDFLQDLGRRATRFHLEGFFVGENDAEALKTLRDKHRAATPVSFVADIATATKVATVLIETFETREIAGRPQRTEFELGLVEYIPAPPQQHEQPPQPPPPPPPPPPPNPTTGGLAVTVIVDGEPNFDFSTIVVRVDATLTSGDSLHDTLTDRKANVWTRSLTPPGSYTATAATTAHVPPLTGSATGVVVPPPDPPTQLEIHLKEGPLVGTGFIVHYWFDKAFVEPCLRGVMRDVGAFAATHPDQKMMIVGNTDLAGSNAYNQALSERRARGVYAYLTVGRAHDAAVAEWDALRRRGSAVTRLEDNWGVREYQWMLFGLGFYNGVIDERHGPLTDAAVRQFQSEHGLTSDGFVGDETWLAVIDAYLSADGQSIPESQFFANCPGEIVKWLGSGLQEPVRRDRIVWRPDRRTEIVFVAANALPGKVERPVTFDLPTPGAVNSDWCVGPSDGSGQIVVLSHKTPQSNTIFVQPVDPRTFPLRGRMTFEDSSVAGGINYVLIAPDGEFLDGEHEKDPLAGRPIPGTTGPDGRFSHATPTGAGIYTLSVLGSFTARLASAPPNSGTSPNLCARLDGSQDFNIVLAPVAASG